MDIPQLAFRLLLQARVGRGRGREALIHYPGVRADSGALEIGLQAGRLVYRRGLGQGDQNDAREGRISQTRKQPADRVGNAGEFAGDLAVVCFGRIQQKQGVPCGRCVEHQVFVRSRRHQVRKRAEDGDLFCARRTEVFFQQRQAVFVEFAARIGQNLGTVLCRFGGRIDSADPQSRNTPVHRGGHVRGRIGRTQMNRMPAIREPDGNRRRDCGLADPPFAHGHYDTRTFRFDRCDQLRQRWPRLRRTIVAGGIHRARRREYGGQPFRSHRRDRAEGHFDSFELGDAGRHGTERLLASGFERRGHGVVVIGCRERSIDYENLVDHADRAQLLTGSLRFGKGGVVGPSHQNECGGELVSESAQALGVQMLLRFEARQRPQTGRARGVIRDEPCPGGREIQQPDGMAGGGSIEDDMIEASRRLGVSEQLRELIEGRNLHGACARELFFHAGHCRGRQYPPIRTDHALPVGGGCRFGVDVERGQTRCARDRPWLRSQGGFEDLIQVGGRVCADDQDPFAAFREGQRGGTGERGFPYSTLAGKEENSCDPVEERVDRHARSVIPESQEATSDDSPNGSRRPTRRTAPPIARASGAKGNRPSTRLHR